MCLKSKIAPFMVKAVRHCLKIIILKNAKILVI